jgi:hypothetical protein
MNKLDFYLTNDPREKALRDAVYRAIAAETVSCDRRCRYPRLRLADVTLP